MTPAPSGIIPIVVTPFDGNGSVDLARFDLEVEFLTAAGCSWIGFGYGSEVTALSQAELATLVGRAVAVGAGSLHVIGNADLTGGPAGKPAIERMADAGADAVMLRPGLPQDQPVVGTITDAVSGTGVPVILQDAPQNTGVDLPAPTLAQLLIDVPEVVGVKVEAPSPAVKIGELAHLLRRSWRSGGDEANNRDESLPELQDRRGKGVVLGGIGGQDFFHELQRGASGTMPGPAFPEVFRAIHARHEGGDPDGAFRLWSGVLPLITLSLRSPETFLTVQKHILTHRKVLNGSALRPPHVPIDPELIPELERLVDHVGLWELIDECRLA